VADADSGLIATGIGRVSRQATIQARNPIEKTLARGQITNATTTLYTAPAAPTVANSVGLNPVTRITEIWLCNTDTATRTVTVYVVESGGSAADNRAILKDATIAAKTSYRIPCETTLEASATVQAVADTTLKVSYLLSGFEFT